MWELGSQERLTYRGAPSGGFLVGEDAFNHQSVETFLSDHRSDPFQIVASFTRTSIDSGLDFFRLAQLCFLPLAIGSDLVGGGGRDLFFSSGDEL